MVPSSLTGVVPLRRALRLTLVLGLLAASQALSGGLDQIEALGGDGHRYALGDIDSINLFNGNVVVTVPLASYDVGAHLSYSFTLVNNSSGGWDRWGHLQATDGVVPNPRSTAGVGWRLSLGDLREIRGAPSLHSCGFSFVSPDGAEHVFYDSLRPADPGDCSSGTWYTRDGSYIRLKTASTSRKDVQLPDGRIFEFLRVGDELWRLLGIRDRFGHRVSVSYGTNVWTVSDTLGRSHKIYWHDGGIEHDYEKPDYITRLDLAGPKGTRANWYLKYSIRERGGCLGLDSNPYWPMWDVPVLYEVSHPGGLENPWRMGTASAPKYDLCGRLLELRLPSRGMLQWGFGDWQFPHYPDIVDGEDQWDPPKGIRARRLLDASGNVIGTWQYKNALNDPDPRWATATLTTVVPPGDAGCTVHHFSARDPLTQDHWAYGLPFTDEIADTAAGLTLYLSQEIFASGGPIFCSGAKLRSVYVDYEHDGDANQRPYGRRVRYHDDGNRWVQTRRSDFDGLGHYRQLETKGNLRASGESRIERTQYNVDFPSVSDPWVLGLYSFQQQQEGGVTARQNYNFDPQTGFLNSKHILRSGTSTSSQDVVVSYTRYPNSNVAGRGQVKDEKWSLGGGTPHLWLLHSYQRGVLSKTEYRKPGGASTGLFKYRATIDQNTGLPTQTIATSGVVTNYTYDLLGRVKRAKPGAGGGACLTYSYTKATGNTGPRWGVIRRNAGCSGNLGQRASWYDVWGRKTRDWIRMPDGAWTRQRYRYNARGWMTGEADWGGDWTEYFDFDAFGRPQKIRPPGADSALHEVRLQYEGDRTVRRGVSMDLNGASPSETRVRAALEHYDSFGRLVEIETPAKPNGNNVVTEYRYDVGNRLRRVSLGGQVRTFTYDNRGFLTQECHPEKGVQGNGCVSYPAYDALGNAKQKKEGSRRLYSRYDFAGRLTKVSSNWDPTVSEWFYDGGDGFGKGKVHLTRRKQRVDFPNDGAGGLDVVVQEKINYTGPAGAPTSHSLAIDLPGNRPTYGFLMGTLYNDAGQRIMKGYPRCFGACEADEPLRQQYYSWTRGFLTKVNGFASSITYHPQGLWKTIVHTNGVTDHQWAWRGYVRSGRVWATNSNGTMIFNTGAFKYDGVGNVKRMGNDDFGYEPSGRLKYAEVACQNSSATSCHRQRYEYDSSGFGNLRKVFTHPRGGTETAVTWDLDPATNRLDPPATYDVAGNMTQSAYHGQLGYDSQDALVRIGLPGDNIPWQFVYTADGERVWTIHRGGHQVVDVRDLDGKPLRSYWRTMSPGSWATPWLLGGDTIWRGGQKLATDSIVYWLSGDHIGFVRHATLDHLGTPRLYTDAIGEATQLDIFPFGRDAPGTSSASVSFTGHERDSLNTGSGVDDMDYMHARFYSPQMARFFQVDPVLQIKRAQRNPQMWNRYAYAANNPLILVDPTGEFASLAFLAAAFVGENTTEPPPQVVYIYVRSFAPFQRFGGGFHGDNRGFTTDLTATSRMSGRVGINRATGQVVGAPQASSSRTSCAGLPCSLVFGDRAVSAKPTIGATNADAAVVITMSGANPLVPGAPDIDLTLTLQVGAEGFSGSLAGDAFPNAEVFVIGPDGAADMLHTFSTRGGPVMGPILYLPGANTRPMGDF